MGKGRSQERSFFVSLGSSHPDGYLCGNCVHFHIIKNYVRLTSNPATKFRLQRLSGWTGKSHTVLVGWAFCRSYFSHRFGQVAHLSAGCLHLPQLTLVVSPLLALISDQLEAMQRFGIPAARIDSTQKPQEVQQIREDIRKGRTKVLMVSVERFKNEGFRRFLSELPISLLVVDEAH